MWALESRQSRFESSFSTFWLCDNFSESKILLSYIYIYIYIYNIYIYSMTFKILVPQPGFESMPPVVERTES